MLLLKEIILFPLKVDSMRLDNNFKGHLIENLSTIKQNVNLLISPYYDAVNIMWFTVNKSTSIKAKYIE